MSSLNETRLRWPVFAIICVYTALLRVLPFALERLGFQIDHGLAAWPCNSSPALAVFLFGGALLPSRSLGLLAPIAVYLAGDISIGLVTGKWDWAFYPGQIWVYAAILLSAMCGWLLRRQRSWGGVIGSAFLASTLLFLLTNFAVCHGGGDRYPHTLAGLGPCYLAALPYPRQLVLSTLLFSGLLFSPFGVRVIQPSPQPATRSAA